jgi:flagellar basal body-associated protein FliL
MKLGGKEMKSSILVLVVAVLALCFSVAFAGNEKINATKPTNITNATENMTNVTTNATNMTNVTTNATNMTNATTPFEGAKGRRY